MCGIICILTKSSTDSSCTDKLKSLYQLFENNIRNRGPDCSFSSQVECGEYKVLFGASVLWLQGSEVTPQPLETDKSILLFNGDIFHENTKCDPFSHSEASSEILPEKLTNDSTRQNGGSDLSVEELFSQSCDLKLRNFYNKGANSTSNEGDTKLFLKTLETNEDIVENLSRLQGPYSFIWLDKSNSILYFGRDIFGRRSLLIGKSGDDLIITSVATKNSGFQFIEFPAFGIVSLNLLSNQLKVFLWNDYNSSSKKLDEFRDFIGQDLQVIKNTQPLFNDVFHEPSQEHLAIFQRLKDLPTEEAFTILLSEKSWLHNISILEKLLLESVKIRVDTQPRYCQKCVLTKDLCTHSLIGVLFSGGVDCAVVALLIDKCLDSERPIDLYNVAFDRGKGYNTPDRITGLQTLEELKSLCSSRQWNFIEINVPEEELDRERKARIGDLIYPLNTILDDSLGCALWFAARGQSVSYKSPSRIVFSGMGADELFGGYTKHRATLKRDGWAGLHQALETEWQNIPYRNLGRDDRVVSDSGRQLRLPYLDENVVKFVKQLPCWRRTCPSSDLVQGFGEKLLLRGLAWRLGFRDVATFKKRALQFGSRIANPKENAHEISTRL